MFQETQIDYAKEKKSVLSLARTFGLKIPGKRPSVTLADFSVTLPVLGDTFDISYAPVLRTGSQVAGSGKIFETVDDIDFGNPFSSNGTPNRLIIPNFNSNGTLINYTITKREIVTNGFTKILKRIITPSDVRPFLQVILPEDNVLYVDSIITLPGTNYSTNPSLELFNDLQYEWFEVPALAEDKVFVENTVSASDNYNVSPGKWIQVNKRFITEYTDLGFTKITFGGGSQDLSSLSEFDTNPALIKQIGNFINNMSLGTVPNANTTMFIKYRVGGGSDTNLGPNTLQSLGVINMSVNGANQVTNSAVRNSLKVNNLLPAVGGKDVPSIEEIRNMVKYNFSSQNRAVTLKDYQTRIAQMPGRFGVPFRSGVYEEQNKIKIYIIGLDSNGNLSNESTTTIKDNIANYLAEFRMINDYVEVTDGKIINLSFEIDLQVDKKVPQSEIISKVISDVSSYMNVNNFEMGDNIYLSNLSETINNVGGVLNVVDLRIYNKVGNNKYSLNEISQPYSDTDTRQIDLTDNNMLYGEANTMFEVKYPSIDIIVRVK
jgi:hypothetical protein